MFPINQPSHGDGRVQFSVRSVFSFEKVNKLKLEKKVSRNFKIDRKMERPDEVQELSNDDQCLLCIRQWNDSGARVDITRTVQEKILQIFPPEVKLINSC